MSRELDFSFLSGQEPAQSAEGTSESKDSILLDAYSNAVIEVVDQTIPSVISVSGTEKRGSGSGIILTADGYAVTNSHVVDRQLELVATTSDGDRLEAKLVGDDPANDLSLIKIQANDLPFAKLGDSKKCEWGNWLSPWEVLSGFNRPFLRELSVRWDAGCAANQGD